jgi:hypothetical protein
VLEASGLMLVWFLRYVKNLTVTFLWVELTTPSYHYLTVCDYFVVFHIRNSTLFNSLVWLISTIHAVVPVTSVSL